MHTTTHRSETVGQLVLVDLDPQRQQVNRAVAGFQAGYSGATLEVHRLDLRQWITWLDPAGLNVFDVERAHIELYARWCESDGKAPATIGRRLSTICGFYNYCSQERLIDSNPAAHVRRPKQNYESSTLGLDRNELGAFLVQAGLSGGRDHALACLLALNGLRISEALGADIDNLDVNRGHRTLFIHRKGGKTATIPLSPRTARALDLYIGERETGPIFMNHDRTRRLDRHASARIVRRLAKRAGIDQAHLAPLAAALVHHRRPRRRRPTSRRPRSRIARRPENDDAIRPRPRISRPPRHLHRFHLRRRRQPLTTPSGRRTSGPGAGDPLE